MNLKKLIAICLVAAAAFVFIFHDGGAAKKIFSALANRAAWADDTVTVVPLGYGIVCKTELTADRPLSESQITINQAKNLEKGVWIAQGAQTFYAPGTSAADTLLDSIIYMTDGYKGIVDSYLPCTESEYYYNVTNTDINDNYRLPSSNISHPLITRKFDTRPITRVGQQSRIIDEFIPYSLCNKLGEQDANKVVFAYTNNFHTYDTPAPRLLTNTATHPTIDSVSFQAPSMGYCVISGTGQFKNSSTISRSFYSYLLIDGAPIDNSNSCVKTPIPTPLTIDPYFNNNIFYVLPIINPGPHIVTWACNADFGSSGGLENIDNISVYNDTLIVKFYPISTADYYDLDI